MLRAPSSHGKSVLLGTDFFFLPSRLPPKSAFTREPSPCKPATPRGSGRHFTSKLYLWAVAGGRHDGKTICAELVGRSRQRPEQSGVDEPRRAENLYAPAVDPDSAGPGRRCRWLLVRQRRVSVSSVLCVRLRDESKESTRVDARPRDTAATEQWDPRRQVGRFTYHIAALLLS